MGQTIDLCTMKCRGRFGVGVRGDCHKRFTIGCTSPPRQQNGQTPKILMQTKFGIYSIFKRKSSKKKKKELTYLLGYLGDESLCPVGVTLFNLFLKEFPLGAVTIELSKEFHGSNTRFVKKYFLTSVFTLTLCNLN